MLFLYAYIRLLGPYFSQLLAQAVRSHTYIHIFHIMTRIHTYTHTRLHAQDIFVKYELRIRLLQGAESVPLAGVCKSLVMWIREDVTESVKRAAQENSRYAVCLCM